MRHVAGKEGSVENEWIAKGRALILDIEKARRRIRNLPGVLEGYLEEMRTRMERLLRESEVDNRRQYRIFLRDLDEVATQLAKIAKEKRLSIKHLKILDLALTRAKKRDFYSANKILSRLDKVLAQAAKVKELVAEYQAHVRSMDQKARELKDRIVRLEGVPKPSRSPEEVRAFVALIDQYDNAASRAYVDYLATVPSREALRTLLDSGKIAGLGIPSPSDETEVQLLLQLVESNPSGFEGLGGRSISSLLEVPGYSNAKLAYRVPDPRAARRALSEALSWLKALRDAERHALRLSWLEDASSLEEKVKGVAEFLSKLPRGGEILPLLTQLRATLESGAFIELQESAKIYSKWQEEAARKFSGDLEGDLRAAREELNQVMRVLRELPPPDKVLTS